MQNSGLSPWEALLREAQTASTLGKPERKAVPEGAYWVGVSILTGDDIFLTPLDEIVHIVPVPKIAKIPHVKHWMRGMTMSRGEIFATTDLSGFLQNKETHITKHARILMLSMGEHYCGILVDKVLGLYRMHASEIQAVSSEDRYRSYQSHLIGIYVKKQIELPIISLQSVAQNPQFKNAVALTSDEPE